MYEGKYSLAWPVLGCMRSIKAKHSNTRMLLASDDLILLCNPTLIKNDESTEYLSLQADYSMFLSKNLVVTS